MLKYRSPFQKLSATIIDNNNIFNIDNSSPVTVIFSNGKNNISIKNYYSVKIVYLEDNNLFLIDEVKPLIFILSIIDLDVENRMILQYDDSVFNDIEIKTSILFSIIFLTNYTPNKNIASFKEYFNILLPKCYKYLVDNLNNYLSKYSEYDGNYLINSGPLNSLYNLLFKNNLKFVFESDRQLLLNLLMRCNSKMTVYKFNKTMDLLGFDKTFVKCIECTISGDEIKNDEFKEFFNLE